MSGVTSSRLEERAAQRIIQLATSVFGNEADALGWLHRPATALNQQRPIDLLDTTEGESQVQLLLHRIDYCLYM